MQVQALPAPPRRRYWRGVVVGVAVLLAAGLTISLVSNVLQKPQTAAEWVDDHMHDEAAQDSVTGETTSTVELYWDLEQMNSVAPTMMDMTPEDFLLGLGLSFESQPTLLAVEQELQDRWDERHPPTPQTDHDACIAAGGQWVGGYDGLEEKFGGPCAFV